MFSLDWLEKQYYQYRRFVPAQLLYHRDYFTVRRELAQGADAIAARADARLRYILDTALRYVPYYQQTVRLTPQDVANVAPRELLQRFPVLEKATIMERQRDFLDRRLDPAKLVYATSGGSSGQGIGLWRNKRLADVEKAFFAQEWSQFGFSFDKSRYLRIGADARSLAHQPPTRVVGNRLLLSPYHLSGQHRAAIVAALNSFKPELVHAYPSSAAALAELITSGDLDFKVGAVLLASEPATPPQLARIAGLFQCPISISYGLTERTNLAFAEYRDGVLGPYQFQALYGVNENRMVDGRPEIVGTSLWNDIMPLIRYGSNDFGAIDATGCCPTIDGRDQEFLVDRQGNRIPGLAIVIDEVTWDFVRLYQVRQSIAGAIRIAVVGRHGALTSEQRQFVLDAQIKRWGGFFDVDIDEVGDIPVAANGKRKLVVNELHGR